MGRYGGEIAVVGVKTRARAALTMAATPSSSSSPSKKIKRASKTPSFSNNNCNYQLRSSSRRRNSSTPENFGIQRDSLTAATAAVAVAKEVEEVANCSGSEVITTTITSNFPPSCSSSNENKEDSDQLSFANDVVLDRCITDLKVEKNSEASSRCITTEEKEKKSSLREEEGTKSNGQDYNSPTTKLLDGKSTVQINRMPSDAEIEEFFAAAEKDLHKRFIDKYNFDIVKDVPLEGRYEWVQIKP